MSETDLESILRLLEGLDARLRDLEGEPVDTPRDPGANFGFLLWTKDLVEALPQRVCTIGEFFNSIAPLIGDLKYPFPRLEHTLAGMAQDMELHTSFADAGDPLLPFREMALDLGRNLSKENREPGEFEGITRAEFLDSWRGAYLKHRSTFQRELGRREERVWHLLFEMLAAQAMHEGEALGAGEMIPRGGSNEPPPGGWPWSIGG